MRGALCSVLSLLIFTFSISAFSKDSASTKAAAPRVLWVPFKGTVELGLAPYLVRALRYAEDHQFDLLVLDVDTFGGRVDAAVTIRDAYLDAKIPTLAWVNKRAISAGALISLACRKIFFTPGSTMGAATPIQMSAEGGAQSVENKVVSYFRAEMGATAERNKRDRKIAEAMVTATEDIAGLVKKGDVLTLTDTSALKTKISDGTVATQEELFKVLEMGTPEVEVFEINWAEKITRTLTDPTVAGALMSIGVLGLILEFQAPGFGLPGLVAITCFAAYFAGHWIVNLAGWEEVILLILGFIFIFIELFLIPGKIIPGALGAVLVFGALFMAGISPKIPFDFAAPDVKLHLNTVAYAFLGAFVGLFIAYFFISRNPRRSPLVLADELPPGAGDFSYEGLLHKTGSLLTDLRPTGKAEIDGKSYEVLAPGEWLKKGSRVRVTRIEGHKIIVEANPS